MCQVQWEHFILCVAWYHSDIWCGWLLPLSKNFPWFSLAFLITQSALFNSSFFAFIPNCGALLGPPFSPFCMLVLEPKVLAQIFIPSQNFSSKPRAIYSILSPFFSFKQPFLLKYPHLSKHHHHPFICTIQNLSICCRFHLSHHTSHVSPAMLYSQYFPRVPFPSLTGTELIYFVISCLGYVLAS